MTKPIVIDKRDNLNFHEEVFKEYSSDKYQMRFSEKGDYDKGKIFKMLLYVIQDFSNC